MIRLGTLFSGMGAPEAALSGRAVNIFAAEIDTYAREQYKAWTGAGTIHTDVRRMNAKPYRGRVDLIIGGPPCQAFSVAGNSKGKHDPAPDPRSDLIYEFVRIVREAAPPMFLFENVPGLVSVNDGAPYRELRKQMAAAGYAIYTKILNANNYGIPQSRRRLFIAGFRADRPGLTIPFEFPRPVPLNETLGDLLEDCVPGRMALSRWHPAEDGPLVPEKYVLSERLAACVMSKGRNGFNDEPVINQNIAHALTTATGRRASTDNYVSDPRGKGEHKIRRLTPREYMRLMGFSDDIPIVVSDTQAYKAAGNSMVVPVIAAITEQMIRHRGALIN